MSRAPYHSPRREEAAAATRAAILQTALRLFTECGYVRTSVEDIAKATRVAPSTVYATFGGKPQLLQVLLMNAVEDPGPPQTLDAVKASTDPVTIVRLTAAGIRAMSEGHTQILKLINATAVIDADAGRIAAQALQTFRQSVRVIAEHLAQLGALADKVDVDRATDIICFIFGNSSWQSLVEDSGWTFDSAHEWLTQLAIDTLLAPNTGQSR